MTRSWKIRGTNNSIINNEATPVMSNDIIYQSSTRSAPTVVIRNAKQNDDDDYEVKEKINQEEESEKIGDDEFNMPLHVLDLSMSSSKFNDSIGDFVITTTKNKKYGCLDSSLHSLLTEDSKSRFSDAMEMWRSVSSINSNTIKMTKKDERPISNKILEISFSSPTSAPPISSTRRIVMDTAKDWETRCTSNHTTAASLGESLSEFEESFVTAFEDYPNAETGSKTKNETKELYNRSFKSEKSSQIEGSRRPKDTFYCPLQSELSSRHKNSNVAIATSAKNYGAARAYNRPDTWIGGSPSITNPAERNWRAKKSW